MAFQKSCIDKAKIGFQPISCSYHQTERKSNGDPKKIHNRFQPSWTHLTYEEGVKLPKDKHDWILTLIPKDVVVIDTDKPNAYLMMVKILEEHILCIMQNIFPSFGGLVEDPATNMNCGYKAQFWFKCIPSS